MCIFLSNGALGGQASTDSCGGGAVVVLAKGRRDYQVPAAFPSTQQAAWKWKGSGSFSPCLGPDRPFSCRVTAALQKGARS